MTTRHTTKIGDVFQTLDKNYVLQLVAFDKLQLNSDVVTVYKKHSSFDIQKLNEEPVYFYHHTTVSAGLKQGLWSKIGKALVPDGVELDFKNYYTADNAFVAEQQPRNNHSSKLSRTHWTVWEPTDTCLRGSQGSYELVVDQTKNIIYHFLFKGTN